MATIDQLIDEHVGRGESKESGVATIKDLFNGIADDLTALNAAGNRPTTIASADATDLASVITLANEIKAALNAVAAPTISTVKGT